MDTKEDHAINKIEKRIIDSRDQFPCDDFQQVSELISYLCSYCGHRKDRHRDK